MRNLENLTRDSCAGLVGSTFRLLPEGGPGFLTLVLEEVKVPRFGLSDPEKPSAPGLRQPFSLFFRGPTEPLLRQRIYLLEHAELGTLEIFLVPVGKDAAGVLYEAAFG